MKYKCLSLDISPKFIVNAAKLASSFDLHLYRFISLKTSNLPFITITWITPDNVVAAVSIFYLLV
jgi:hypothetical protein